MPAIVAVTTPSVRASGNSAMVCLRIDIGRSADMLVPPTNREQAVRLCCVNDDVPPVTVALLRDACVGRGVELVEVHAPGFAFDAATGLEAGDMLYRPAVSLAAIRVEQFLWSPGVATFHADPEGVFFGYTNYHLLMARAGVPVPRAIPAQTTDRALLRAHVEALGGLPVVLKLPGGEGGIGTVRIDSLPGLHSTLDLLHAQGHQPLLCAFVPDAVPWRAVVIGDRVVAAHRNRQPEDDFRSHASTDPHDFTAPRPSGLDALAVAAVRALRLEFGGVDLLAHPSGRLYVLEANFPCYFADPQIVAGIDVAGMMVDHLITKARGLRPGAAADHDTDIG